MEGTGHRTPSDSLIGGTGQLASNGGGGGGSKEEVGSALATPSGNTIRVKKSGRGPLSMDHTTSEKARAAFAEFRENLVRKMEDHYRDQDFNGASVSFNFGTYTAKAITTDGIALAVDLTRMLGINEANSHDFRLYAAAQQLEKVIADAGLIEPTSHSYIKGESDHNRIDVLGDSAGPNGFVESCKQMDNWSRQQLENRAKTEVCRGLLKAAGISEGRETRIMVDYENIVLNHRAQCDALKEIKTNLRQTLEGENNLSREQLEEAKKDVDAIDKKIEEIDLSKLDETTLMLVLTAIDINTESRLSESNEKAKAIQDLLEHHFTETLHIGKTTRDPKTKRASLTITKPYKEYAAMIAAAAVFSKGSSVADVRLMQYNNTMKIEYQKYLSSENIVPRSNLGTVGALVFQNFVDQNEVAKGRNWNNLYIPKGVSQETRSRIITDAGPVEYEL